MHEFGVTDLEHGLPLAAHDRGLGCRHAPVGPEPALQVGSHMMLKACERHDT